jgi:hypothetical protein
VHGHQHAILPALNNVQNIVPLQQNIDPVHNIVVHAPINIFDNPPLINFRAILAEQGVT